MVFVTSEGFEIDECFMGYQEAAKGSGEWRSFEEEQALSESRKLVRDACEALITWKSESDDSAADRDDFELIG